MLKVAADEAFVNDAVAGFKGAGLGVDVVPVGELLALPPAAFPRAVGLSDGAVWFDFADVRVEVGPQALRFLAVVDYDLRWMAPDSGAAITETRRLAELLVASGASRARIRLLPELADPPGRTARTGAGPSRR